MANSPSWEQNKCPPRAIALQDWPVSQGLPNLCTGTLPPVNFPLMYLILDRFIHMQNKQTNPQKLRIFKNVITVFFLPAGSYIFHGLLYSQKKKIIMAMDFSQRLLQESLRTNLRYIFPFYVYPSVQLSRSLFLQSVEDAKEKGGRKGGRGGKKEKGSFLLVFFLVCAFSNSTDPTVSEPGSAESVPDCLPEEGRDECKGVQWIVLHDAAPAFSISCPVHCTAKLAELEGSEALL